MSARDFESAVGAVEARLRAIRASADPSMALGPEAEGELRRLRRARGRDPELRAAFAAGWLHWHRYLALPDGQADAERGQARADLTPCLLRGMEDLPDGLLADMSVDALPQALTTLGRAAAARDREAIMAAAALWRRLTATIPDDSGSWPMAMVTLCLALQGAFECTGDLKYLDEAIEAGRRGLEAAPLDHPELDKALCNVANALHLRALNSGTAGGGYLDEAIDYYRRAVQATPTGHKARPGILSTLAVALLARFEAKRSEADLAESIACARQALDNDSKLDPRRYKYQGNLAHALRTRHAISGDPGDLAEAIQLLRDALDWTPARHPDHASNCLNLAAALWTRYEESYEGEVLDRVIGLVRRAAATMRDGDPARALQLSNLSVALAARFWLAGAAADLDAAIDIARQAIAAAPAGNVNQGRYQSNLCGFLRARGDAAAAVEAGEAAVEATASGDPELAVRLSNLANAQRDAGDPGAAIAALRQAEAAASADRVRRPLIRSNLGMALSAAGQRDEATRVLRSALADAPPGHPSRPTVLANLASVLRQTGVPEDRAEAIDQFTEVADTESAGPSLRIRAARAASHASDLSSPAQASHVARLLQMAVGLLPSVAPRRLHRGDQQRHLAELSGLASDAAALVLEGEGPDSAQRALGLLETGRGVLLSQALDTRTDLTLLRRRHPVLAARYTRLRDLLDSDPGDLSAVPSAVPGGGGTSAGPGGIGLGGIALSMEGQAGDRQRLAASFAEVVAAIRERAGFSDFMRPPALDDLMAQATGGPIAVLNVSGYRSDALLLTSGGIQSVPLPELTPDAVRERVLSLQQGPVSKELAPILDWLWETVTGPVLDALGLRSPAPGGSLPRMWWVPGGQLSLLPIHAAGHAMDRVVSSYVPTVRALSHARASAMPAAPMRSLIVTIPTSPGGRDLPWAQLEAQALEKVLPRPTVLTRPAAAQVLGQLGEYAIAHFACHGTTNLDDPSRSGLILADQPLTVSALSAVQLPAGQLAYLSACRTAITRAEGLADEAIHVTSAFQLAGFPHVIGTLWLISDNQGMALAVKFHIALRAAAGSFDPAHSARVLHEITHQVRAERPEAPHLWASHIHVGA
jgi:CHAT domain/Tetratricopeptide repeat